MAGEIESAGDYTIPEELAKAAAEVRAMPPLTADARERVAAIILEPDPPQRHPTRSDPDAARRVLDP